MSRFLTIQLCLKRVSACVLLWRFMFQAEVCAFFRSLGEFRKIVLLCKEEDKADCSNGVWITLTRTLIPYNISVLVCFSRNRQKIEGFLPLFCIFVLNYILFQCFQLSMTKRYNIPDNLYLRQFRWQFNFNLSFMNWNFNIWILFFIKPRIGYFKYVHMSENMYCVAFSCLSISGPNVLI